MKDTSFLKILLKLPSLLQLPLLSVVHDWLSTLYRLQHFIIEILSENLLAAIVWGFFPLLPLLLHIFLYYLTAFGHAVRLLLWILLLFQYSSMHKVPMAKVFAQAFIFFLNWQYYKFGHATVNLSFLIAILRQWQ